MRSPEGATGAPAHRGRKGLPVQREPEVPQRNRPARPGWCFGGLYKWNLLCALYRWNADLLGNGHG